MILEEFAKVLESAKEEYNQIINGDIAESFCLKEEINKNENWMNILAKGDNLKFMKSLMDKGFGNSFGMIYLDPPFFTKSKYDASIQVTDLNGKKMAPIKCFAYDDIWQRDLAEYLKMLSVRLLLMRDLLSNKGTIWIHLDWHVCHYVKVIADAIFGEQNFVNEVVWQYKSGGSGKRHFARKHDTILVYSKTKGYFLNPPKEKSYNRGFKPYRFKGVKEYKDELGWYTMVNMKDVWSIDMVGRTSKERTGYATQKPEALLERMILSATEEGGLVGDFFSGSGTLAKAAEKTGRKWVLCDSNELAIAGTIKRLENKAAVSLYEEENQQEILATPVISVNRKILDGMDKDLVEISMEGYSIKEFSGISEDDRERLEKVAKKDERKLISYFELDLDYDGEIFRPKVFLSEDKEYSYFVEKSFLGKIAVKTTDIFGNYQLTVFTI